MGVPCQTVPQAPLSYVHPRWRRFPGAEGSLPAQASRSVPSASPWLALQRAPGLPLPASIPLTLRTFTTSAAATTSLTGRSSCTLAPGTTHQLVVGAIYRLLWSARRAWMVVLTAPVDFVPQLTTSLQPDVVVIEEGEVGEARLTRPPLLVVDVPSSSSHRHDVESKRLAYAAAAAVPFYWLIDAEPPVTLTVLRLAADDYESVAEARGDEELVIEEPFPVSLVPARLLDV